MGWRCLSSAVWRCPGATNRNYPTPGSGVSRQSRKNSQAGITDSRLESDRMDTMTAELLLLPAPTVEEVAPKIAAGRLPLMAFVDSETERVLQESATMFGRHLIQKGGIGKAIDYLSQQRSPQLLIVDISGI